jgi:hypothetical protein
MKNLSWNDFKKHVDMLLERQGLSGDAPIDYIDITEPVAKEIGVEGNGHREVFLDGNENYTSVYQ